MCSEGEMAFVCDGKWIKGGPGAYVFGPREIPHGFKVIGTTPARMLLMCAPAGFERFVLEMGEDLTSPAAPPDMAKLVALAAKYKIDVLGPLPEEAGVPVLSTERFLTASGCTAGLPSIASSGVYRPRPNRELVVSCRFRARMVGIHRFLYDVVVNAVFDVRSAVLDTQ